MYISGGGGDGGGGGGGGNDDMLCFTRGALVEMADGSLKAIANVREGDHVYTGFPGDSGLVTEVLTHDVGREVPVAVVPTTFGDLVGTPDHPIYWNDEWVELSEAFEFNDFEKQDGKSSMSTLEGSIDIQNVDVQSMAYMWHFLLQCQIMNFNSFLFSERY